MQMAASFEDRTTAFWKWFVVTEREIARALEESDYDWLQNYLGARVKRLAAPAVPGFGWEVGPGELSKYEFTLSPVVASNLSLTEYAIYRAPPLDGWEWHAWRQPKKGRARFRITFPSGIVHYPIDAAEWRFGLKRRKDEKLDVLFVADALGHEFLSQSLRTRIAYLLLDNIVGEDVTLQRVGVAYVALAAEIPLPLPLAPIEMLTEAVLSART